MKTIVIATLNQGKVKEFQEILPCDKYNIKSLNFFSNIVSLEETGTTFEENAVLKATNYGNFCNEICIADDSGLVVDALNGVPGVYSSRFAKSDKERCEKLLDLMKDVPENHRKARFVCTAALYLPEKLISGLKQSFESSKDYNFYPNVITTMETLEGYIAFEKKGCNGFGFDPIFFVPDKKKHLAELSSEEKNIISHRGKALKKIKNILNFL